MGRKMVPGNFQHRGILLIWMFVGQGPTVLLISACLDGLATFTVACHMPFSFSLSLGDGPV